MHTERTHTEQNTRYNNMQHREQHTDTSTENSIEQTQYAHRPDTDRTQNNLNTEQRTEQTQNSTQPQRTENSAHNYRTYSFDLYHEQIYIKNSNTIELYTILQDKV